MLQGFKMNLQKNRFLEKSYRIPSKIQDIANCILNRIPDHRRVKKDWAPRPEEGYIEYITSIEDIPLTLETG